MTNAQAAEILAQMADLLSISGADSFRIRSYQQAAESLQSWAEEIEEVYADQGLKGLRDIPDIGKSLAEKILASIQRYRQGLERALLGEILPLGEHAHIERERNRYVLMDLGAGQTVVNDQRISRRYLRDGDYVTIGQTVLQYDTRAISQPGQGGI